MQDGIYMGQTGRQIKIQEKEHKGDSKLDFRKMSFRIFEEQKTSIRLEFNYDLGKRK